MAEKKIKFEELPERAAAEGYFPSQATHDHNNMDQPAITTLKKKYISVSSNAIRIEFEGGGYLILGFCGVDAAGQPMFGLIINDGINDSEFIGLQKGGF